MNTSGEWVGLMSRNPNRGQVFKCRYGQVGDRLWVRETFKIADYDRGFKVSANSYALIMFKDSQTKRCHWNDWLEKNTRYGGSTLGDGDKWRPSIHMPRWASRITLEITGLRVERLQQITGQDALNEGIQTWYDNHPAEKLEGYVLDEAIAPAYFAVMWNEINAKRGYSWETNPFVWCISFRKLD
jgi:hypothetical protein